jgi:serine/threonine protein kinase
MDVTTSDAAHAAWRRKYDTPTITLGLRSRDDIGPFGKIGEDLGEGGNGRVYRTELDGVPVALKISRLFPRKEREEFLRELNILQKISKERHKHVIQLVGGFELHSESLSKVGLLIWPVAQCNLKEYLENLDVVAKLETRLVAQPDHQGKTSWEEEAAFNTIYAVVSNDLALPHPSLSSHLHAVTEVHELSQRRLYTTFGCLAEVIDWLHNVERVRHRDLNAKQILLASHGIWMADFGMSKERSEQTRSTTQSFQSSTPKYHAPERQNRERCGRPEDIFALGCIFLEMAYRLCGHDLANRIPPPYHAHLDQLDRWLRPLRSAHEEGKPELSQLADLIKGMMAEDAEQRPRIKKVVTILRAMKVEHGPNLFGSCCSSGT